MTASKRVERRRFRRSIALSDLAVAIVVLAGACAAPEDTSDLKPPADFAPPPVRALRPVKAGERPDYGPGFYPLEQSVQGTSWHWMAKRGEVRLGNLTQSGGDRVLRLTGWVPVEMM